MDQKLLPLEKFKKKSIVIYRNWDMNMSLMLHGWCTFYTLYKLWRITPGNSLMNIQLKKSDIEKLNKNKDSCENVQFICIGQRNEMKSQMNFLSAW